MNLTKQELLFIKYALINKRMYRGADLNLGATVWEEWMQDFYLKTLEELKKHE